MNNLLSIVIPTYNRCDILKENIEAMFEKIKEFNLGVYISDDSNNDDTKKMIESLSVQLNYPFFFYEKNTPSLGHDENCIATLKKSKSKFVWYLGDSMIIPLKILHDVMDIIHKNENDIDFICLNSLNKNIYQSGIVADTHDFIVNSTWHMTLTGATIYSHKVIEWILNNDFNGRYRNFMQLGVILQYCEQNKAIFYWCGDFVIFHNKNKRSYWSKNTISVFAHDWWHLINNFDNFFTTCEKTHIAVSHSKNTGIFGFKHFCHMRVDGGLNMELIKKYRSDIIKTSKLPFFLINIIAYIPIKPMRFIATIIKHIKKN